MADNLGSVARPFLEVRPILRSIGIASDPRKLILAVLGLLAMIGGWAALDRVIEPTRKPGLTQVQPGSTIRSVDYPTVESLRDAARLMVEPPRSVIGPFASLFERRSGPARWFRSALMALWSITVWGIFGGAIARVAVVQASVGHRVGIGSALRFALRKSGSLIGAPLTPWLAISIFSAILAAFGLIHRIPGGVGRTIAEVLGFFPLVLGLLMAFILLGLAAGWPLMHLTVAAEGEDAADALSRSYSYVNQRFIRYASHLALAWGVGTVGLIGVIWFARAVLMLSDWGVALGAPATDPASSLGSFWVVLVGWLVHGWIYSYFWSATAIIYLILRRDVDGTDWHDVYLPEQDADSFAGETPLGMTEVAIKSETSEVA
ncbi:hypothetical protein P12x_001179 [Tundrisphaera lichenicola]|uniref:hypothetical protein n=1 Tax=Tundrisphaera lichenicola TaxID=2029860 RepID=UPI003EBBB833